VNRVKIAGKGEIIIYESKGVPGLEVRLEKDNIWMTQAQIAELFDSERSVVTKHLGNIYKDKELSRTAICAKIAQVQIEGGRP